MRAFCVNVQKLRQATRLQNSDVIVKKSHDPLQKVIHVFSPAPKNLHPPEQLIMFLFIHGLFSHHAQIKTTKIHRPHISIQINLPSTTKHTIPYHHHPLTPPPYHITTIPYHTIPYIPYVVMYHICGT